MFRRTNESDDNTRNGLSVIQGGQVHLRTLILLRWVAVAGQTATVLIVFFGLGFELPLIACFGAIFSRFLNHQHKLSINSGDIP